MSASIRKSGVLVLTLLLTVALLTPRAKALSQVNTATDHFEGMFGLVTLDVYSTVSYTTEKATYIDVYSLGVYAKNLNNHSVIAGALFYISDGAEEHYADKTDDFIDPVEVGESIYHECLWEYVDMDCRYEKNGNLSGVYFDIHAFTNLNNTGGGHDIYALSDFSWVISPH